MTSESLLQLAWIGQRCHSAGKGSKNATAQWGGVVESPTATLVQRVTPPYTQARTIAMPPREGEKSPGSC